MGLRINNNIDALVAHRNLKKNDEALSSSLQKLSTGQEINQAADGPAALVISENMRAQIGGLQQATKNNEIAVSVVQTAEGALNEVSSLLVSIRQRAIAAANSGASDPAMTDANQTEIENALGAIDRIASTTQFGSRQLLDGSIPDGLTFQVGANAGQTVKVQMHDMHTMNLGREKKVDDEGYVEYVDPTNSSQFASLADIDVTSEQGSQDALSIIDQAISEVSSTRGDLGAFQKNTLESNLSSLRVATENMVSSESTIRDVDMAQEMAMFTRNQIMSQSATAQLAQANAMPQNVLRLLNG